VAVRRDNGEKTSLSLDGLAAGVSALLAEVQNGLFNKAKKNLDEHTYPATTLDEAKAIVRKGGFIKMMWCGDLECEIKMKEDVGVSSRCIPFAQEKLGDVCPCCGKPAKHMVYWGVAY